MLPLNLSDTAATSQDGSSLESIAPIAGRQCYMQDASGRGLCCALCGKGFNSKKQTKIHMKSHVMENLYQCVLCGSAFIS